jgi:hypothetical protein
MTICYHVSLHASARNKPEACHIAIIRIIYAQSLRLLHTSHCTYILYTHRPGFVHRYIRSSCILVIARRYYTHIGQASCIGIYVVAAYYTDVRARGTSSYIDARAQGTSSYGRTCTRDVLLCWHMCTRDVLLYWRTCPRHVLLWTYVHEGRPLILTYIHLGRSLRIPGIVHINAFILESILYVCYNHITLRTPLHVDVYE